MMTVKVTATLRQGQRQGHDGDGEGMRGTAAARPESEGEAGVDGEDEVEVKGGRGARVTWRHARTVVMKGGGEGGEKDKKPQTKSRKKSLSACEPTTAASGSRSHMLSGAESQKCA